jgi:signal transduction histidine kinase/DNA-binding response OmpR family regulator
VEKIRVLVVEDESVISSDISNSLEQMGYAVAGIEVSGADAIRAAQELKPDMVLMDIVLQGEMDGIQAAGHIRSKLDIPVIYLSAYAEEKVLERAKLTDPFGYLIKPFENRELHFSIQMALYKYMAEQELKRLNRALKTLSGCNHALVHATDEEELLKDICRIIVGVGGYALALVGIPEDDERKSVRTAAFAGRGEGYLENSNITWDNSDSGQNPLASAIRSGMPISVQDISMEMAGDHWGEKTAGYGFASCIALPLISEGKSIGVLGIFAEETGTFSPDEYDQLVDVADNLSYWIISLRSRVYHKLAEAALQASHERFIAVMDSLDAVVYVADMDTHELLFVNKHTRDNFGYEAGEACWRMLQGEGQVGPCEFCTNRHLLDEAGRPTGVYNWEFWNPITTSWYDMRDRAIRWVDGRMVRLEIATNITKRKWAEEELNRHREHLAELVEERTAELTAANRRLQREIAERERAEDELLKAQKLESMGILAGGIAHDFNNILTSILSNVSLARMHAASDTEQVKNLLAAEKAALRARDLTQQLLTFSRSGVPVKKPASIVQLLEDSAEFALMGSGVKLDYSIAEDLWAVEVDKAQISQVISNLVINAAQAMPEGGNIRVRVENAEVKEREIPYLKVGKYMRLSIRDEGVGILKKHLTKIFDPYFTTKKGGSGLGLASTYSIVKNHGGHISVQSESGAGTMFTIYLPASTESVLAALDAKEEVFKGSGNILVMDDDPNIRDSVAEVMMFLGYKARFAEDGNEAIDLYLKARENGEGFDAVLMDLTVPGGMGGIEAINRLREIEPSIKAVVSSGYSNDSIMSNYASYGFSGVINKPYKIEELSRVLYGVINGQPT